MFEIAWTNKTKPYCKDKLKCKNCYLQWYCEQLEKSFKDKKSKAASEKVRKKETFKLESS